jgi:hypothetical protein
LNIERFASFVTLKKKRKKRKNLSFLLKEMAEELGFKHGPVEIKGGAMKSTEAT